MAVFPLDLAGGLSAGLRNGGGGMGDGGHGWQGWGPGFFTLLFRGAFTLGLCGVKKGGVNELGKAGRLLSFWLSVGLGQGRFWPSLSG